MTGITADEISGFLKNKEILPEQKKRRRRRSKGTRDKLHKDKMLLYEVKQRKKNLATVWIDYQKVYDMVPLSWVMESLNMMGITKNK